MKCKLTGPLGGEDDVKEADVAWVVVRNFKFRF